MQVAMSSYSLLRWQSDNQKTPVDCAIMAKELGYDAIEFSEFAPPSGKTLVEYAAEIKKHLDSINFPIVNFAVGGDLISGSNGNFDAEVKRICEMVDIAEILGAKRIRHDVTQGYVKDSKYSGFSAMLPTLANGCRIITEYAAKKGIETLVENHGFFFQDSERVEALINEVNHDNFGLLLDIGNFLCVDEQPIHAVSRLAHYAKYVHCKDFLVRKGMEANPGTGFFGTRGGNYLRGTIIGHGDVPVLQCVRIIKQTGYNGIFSVEFEGMEENIDAVKIGLENVRRFIE